MLKLRQISIALALALMLCVTMLGSGAFAQSVARNDTHAMATNTVATNAQQTTQSTTIDLRQTQLTPNRLWCYWLPGHLVSNWVPGHWVHIPWYPYWRFVPGHWTRYWVPGHRVCVVIR